MILISHYVSSFWISLPIRIFHRWIWARRGWHRRSISDCSDYWRSQNTILSNGMLIGCLIFEYPLPTYLVTVFWKLCIHVPNYIFFSCSNNVEMKLSKWVHYLNHRALLALQFYIYLSNLYLLLWKIASASKCISLLS